VTVLRTQLGGVARRPARLLLTGLAMLVAAFVVYGAVLAQHITARTVIAGLSGTPEAANVVVGDLEHGVPADTVSKIRALPGVAEVAARTSLWYPLGTQGGAFLAVYADPGSGPLSTVRLVDGAYPKAPNEIAVSRRTAEWYDLTVGGAVTAKRDETATVTLKVTGVVDDDDGAAGRAYTTDQLLAALDRLDSFNQVDIRLAPGGSIEQVRAVVQDSTPVRTGAEARRAEAERAAADVKIVFALIGVFVAIAVAAAALVAISTFRIVFAQRMRQLALLRAVGAGRRAIVWALTVEGALTGLVAGIVGVLGAYVFGRGLPAVLRGFDLAVSDPGTPIGAAVAVVIGCVVVTVLAVLAPASTASRVSPLEALRDASTTGARSGIGAVRAVFGSLLAVAAILLAAGVGAGLPEPGAKNYSAELMLFGVVASGTLAFFALVALGPVLLRPVLAVVGWPLRRAGALGRLAVGGVGGAPRRAAAVSVVVALGVALIGGSLVLGESLRVLADREMTAMAPADFRLHPSGETLPAGIGEQAKARSELTDVTTFRTTWARIDGAAAEPDGNLQIDVTDLDPRRLRADRRLHALEGSLDELGPGRIALGLSMARYLGARVGDEVTVGTVRLRLVATLQASPLGSSAIVDPSDLDRMDAPAGATGLIANAAQGGESGLTAARKALQAVATGGLVEVLADQRDEMNAQIDALLGVALGLVGLTVLIAVVGVGSTTALSVVERIREAGLLRAVGLSPGGLRTMLTTEAALYGTIGAFLGLLLGLPYAWLFIAALGEGVPIEWPVGQLALAVVALTGLTALAGVLPARRAAKVSPMAAIAQDS
jgi:putative ABC transport system permease protein